MYFALVETLYGFRYFAGMSDRYDRQRHDAFWQAQYILDSLHPVRPGVYTQPHRAQSQGVRRKQSVLGGGGAVLNPVVSVFFSGQIAADDNGGLGCSASGRRDALP